MQFLKLKHSRMFLILVLTVLINFMFDQQINSSLFSLYICVKPNS